MNLAETRSPSTHVLLDDVDRRILSHMRLHARDSFRQAAAALKLHPSTVIKRVQRLQREGVIASYGANVDYLKLGYEFMAFVDVRATKGYVPEVGAKLRQLGGVVSVWDTTGTEDIRALLACKTRLEFNRAIKNMGHIPHIERTITHVVLNVIKSEWEFDLG